MKEVPGKLVSLEDACQISLVWFPTRSQGKKAYIAASFRVKCALKIDGRAHPG